MRHRLLTIIAAAAAGPGCLAYDLFASGAYGSGDEHTEMVEVAAGSFMMGCNSAVDTQCTQNDDETPYHAVSLSAFLVDKTEVTQRDYLGCVEAEACKAPESDTFDPIAFSDYPAFVEWLQAKTYCAWAGKRLPTEAEWEKAARGADGRKYPWGNSEPDCTLANLSGCGEDNQTRRVGSYPPGASPYGALDMLGNAAEYVSDYYSSNTYDRSGSTDEVVDPTGPRESSSSTAHVGRGGGFYYSSSTSESPTTMPMRLTERMSTSASFLGFRCAKSAQ